MKTKCITFCYRVKTIGTENVALIIWRKRYKRKFKIVGYIYDLGILIESSELTFEWLI